MSIVVLKLPDVKHSKEDRPKACPYCQGGVDPVRWTMVCLAERSEKCQEIIPPILRNFASKW
jgi:hypothetical protein